MIEFDSSLVAQTDATETTKPSTGKTAYELRREAYVKMVVSVLATVDLLEYKRGGAERIINESIETPYVDCIEPLDGGNNDEQRRELLKAVRASADKKGGGPARNMVYDFADSALDKLFDLRAKGRQLVSTFNDMGIIQDQSMDAVEAAVSDQLRVMKLDDNYSREDAAASLIVNNPKGMLVNAMTAARLYDAINDTSILPIVTERVHAKSRCIALRDFFLKEISRLRMISKRNASSRKKVA